MRNSWTNLPKYILFKVVMVMLLDYYSYNRITPWRNWDEWLLVKQTLFDGSYEDIRNGLSVVALWKARGKIPHSVESTAHLLEVSDFHE